MVDCIVPAGKSMTELPCALQLVYERIRGFVKEVQAGGPSPSQHPKSAQGAAPIASAQDSQAAAKFREEELARQKASLFWLSTGTRHPLNIKRISVRFPQPPLKELCPMMSEEPCMSELHTLVTFRLCCPTSPWLI